MVRKKQWKKAAAVAGAAVVFSVGATYLYLNNGLKIPAYTAARVIDGDTFETTEKQLIRLAYVNSPEIEYCYGPESKKALENLVLGKKLYIKVMYRDGFDRLLSLVYTDKIFVNELMVRNGYSTFRTMWGNNDEVAVLKKAQDESRAKSRGIYSDKCTQETNPKNDKCLIKGNINESTKIKIYVLPGCESYTSTKVQLYMGDQWFCSEAEAREAGFKKAGGCNGN